MKESEHLDKAISCIRSLPQQEPRVRAGTNKKFQYQVAQFLTSDVAVDWVEQGLSLRTVADKVEELLIESYEEDDVKEEFITSFQDYLSTTIGSAKPSYTVVFPINFATWHSPPDSFKRGVQIDRISIDEWEEYRAQAEEKEGIAEFFTKHPNEFDEDTFTFWKANVNARDVIVPPNIVQESVTALLGQIQYSFHLRHLHPRNDSDGLPKHSWSDLRSPPVFLVTEEGSEIDYAHVIDQNYRSPEQVNWMEDKRRDRFDSLPTLSTDSKYDRKLIDAFHTYHLGMAESSTHTSFLYFWQGVDRLATQPNENVRTQTVVERARFVHSLMGDTDPIFDDVLNDLAEKRNALVHEGPSTSITRRFQDYTKILLDALITLYLGCRGSFSIREIADLLEYGPGDWKRAELLRKVSEMEFDFEV